jgi:bifunctional N-acetylglucosamine-1-phosphate-uridyltransferase/glucosamine-1-phosphate-acetyltransferase GlmU-like protein
MGLVGYQSKIVKAGVIELKMETTLKIVIPMAGLGTRLRPHTWSKPKQLVSVAGKPVLDHVLDTLKTLPDPENVELVNIVGYLGDQIQEHIQTCYPNIKSHFVLQEIAQAVPGHLSGAPYLKRPNDGCVRRYFAGDRPIHPG